jgi:nicotinate-nucleotide adenylyltransferase
MRTVALFGGSFDPPHIGHIEIVNELKKLPFIDKVVVMPTYLNPFKKSFVADANKRVEWLQKVFNEDEKVEVSRFEVSQNRPTPTIESVQHLTRSYDTIYVVIGADNLASLQQWKNYETLQKKVTFIVATRDEIDIDGDFITLQVKHPISSSQLRQHIDTTQLPHQCAEDIQKYYTRKTMEQRVENITQVLDKHKAEAIEVFDLREKDYFVDFAIIASSLGQKHTTALLDHLKKELKPAETFNNVDESGDWVVIDLGDILIHIMTPEYRVKYDMETFLSELASQNA